MSNIMCSKGQGRKKGIYLGAVALKVRAEWSSTGKTARGSEHPAFVRYPLIKVVHDCKGRIPTLSERNTPRHK